jgi:ADP-heptose:LPS heptosyltransferase
MATILLVRDAAVGDGIMITPAIHDLAEAGHEVHVACKKNVGDAVYPFNPWITKLHRLESCADTETCTGMTVRKQKIKEIGDKIHADTTVDLAFTCEGKYLFHSDHPNYQASPEFRRALCAHANYYEHINCRVLGCKRTRPELYAGFQEDNHWARLRAANLGTKFIQIQLTGSSINKCYPYWPVVIMELQKLEPRAIIATTGDPQLGALLELACLEHGCDPRRIWATCRDKRFTLRDSIIMTKYVNVVVGPETGVMNAAACFDTPKVVLLSHSNADNLCKGWDNWFPIQALTPCSPCWRIVSPGDDCDYVTEAENPDIAGALRCMASIPPELIVNKIREALKC